MVQSASMSFWQSSISKNQSKRFSKTMVSLAAISKRILEQLLLLNRGNTLRRLALLNHHSKKAIIRPMFLRLFNTFEYRFIWLLIKVLEVFQHSELSILRCLHVIQVCLEKILIIVKCFRFLVLLREYISDCVDTISKRTTCYERNPDNINFLIEIDRRNIAVSDGDHGYDGEIQRRNVSEAPVFIF